MSSSVIFEAIGDAILWSTSVVFDNIGNSFNDLALILGFVGLFYWLNLQRKFNAEAEKDPNQLK